LCCNVHERFLIYLGYVDTTCIQREPKRFTHRESFGDRQMFLPGGAVVDAIRDPSRAINEQRRGDLVLAPAPFIGNGPGFSEALPCGSFSSSQATWNGSSDSRSP
jgi:hypothetical protein